MPEVDTTKNHSKYIKVGLRFLAPSFYDPTILINLMSAPIPPKPDAESVRESEHRKNVGRDRGHSPLTLKERIAALEEELARTKRMARCPHEPKPGVGGLIQRLRMRQELSINQLAQASGVSKGLISRLEREDDPNPEIHTLRRLVHALGITMSGLFATVEREASGPCRKTL